MSGINIDQTDAFKENIPEDLNSLAYSAYRIPDIKRRMLIRYTLLSILISVFIFDRIYTWINFSYAYVLLILISIYTLLLSSKMKIPQSDVIQLVGKYINHSIGYYSVALTFRGLLLNPVWTCIMYDHHNPPQNKSIVEIDANTGLLVGTVYSESLENNA